MLQIHTENAKTTDTNGWRWKEFICNKNPLLPNKSFSLFSQFSHSDTDLYCKHYTRGNRFNSVALDKYSSLHL